jgi:hypothetical protein
MLPLIPRTGRGVRPDEEAEIVDDIALDEGTLDEGTLDEGTLEETLGSLGAELVERVVVVGVVVCCVEGGEWSEGVCAALLLRLLPRRALETELVLVLEVKPPRCTAFC